MSDPDTHHYVILDVFTDVPLQGNQLAVFTDADGLGDDLMQRTARELNLSETVFLVRGDRSAHSRARIFTPATELPFAGHPVLGAAFVLGRMLGCSTVQLQTGAGLIAIALRREGARIVHGEMEQPIPTWEAFDGKNELLAALGVARSGLPVEVYCNGPNHVYVELPDDDAVARLAPDLGALAALGRMGVTCFSSSGSRVKTRVFAPGLGVPEDPATGSAAGPLALHLARHGRIAFGERIEISQGIEIDRPSILHAVAEGSPHEVRRVAVGGSAVLVARGEFRLQ
jgi:trans-2,3-dihydro-3-hydroxyanthranilate isomerase